jgi:hypothetical protein
MKFLVWRPGMETRRDARAIEAGDPQEAARDFVERKWEPDDGECIEVKVLTPGAPHARIYHVDVDFDPSFSAMLIGRTDAEPDDADPEREARLLTTKPGDS